MPLCSLNGATENHSTVGMGVQCPFPLSDQTLGHSFLPQGSFMGQLHLHKNHNWLEDHDWVVVFAHEIFHSVGINHSEIEEALMYASDRNIRTRSSLYHMDDRYAFWTQYPIGDGSLQSCEKNKIELEMLREILCK